MLQGHIEWFFLIPQSNALDTAGCFMLDMRLPSTGLEAAVRRSTGTRRRRQLRGAYLLRLQRMAPHCPPRQLPLSSGSIDAKDVTSAADYEAVNAALGRAAASAPSGDKIGEAAKLVSDASYP